MNSIPAPGTKNAEVKQSVSKILAPYPRPGILELVNSKPDLVEKHLSRHIRCLASGCWIWTGPTTKSKGCDLEYGCFTIVHEGRRYKVGAHRASFAYFKQEDPGDLYVCHECDNTLCINSDHLFSGTATDNMQDMAAKGRGAYHIQSGSKNHAAKANEADIDLVVSLLPKLNNKQISARLDYRISHGMISRIRLGKAWSAYTGITPENATKLIKRQAS